MPNQTHASAVALNRVLTDLADRIKELESLDLAPDSTAIDTKLAALFLGVAEGTLEVWRSTRRVHLPHMKFGRAVRYTLGDLRKFRDECRIEVSDV